HPRHPRGRGQFRVAPRLRWFSLQNRLPNMLLPKEALSGFESFDSQPLVPVSGSHAIVVIGVYSLIFLVLALVPTWKRDVRE
ncbi:MAG: hypothetical protein J2P37_36380, partial [Ktedonobacteraceae bacterium]|nr:hypothetical protein [Ktedonobacteraceae bacterium]